MRLSRTGAAGFDGCEATWAVTYRLDPEPVDEEANLHLSSEKRIKVSKYETLTFGRIT